MWKQRAPLRAINALDTRAIDLSLKFFHQGHTMKQRHTKISRSCLGRRDLTFFIVIIEENVVEQYLSYKKRSPAICEYSKCIPVNIHAPPTPPQHKPMIEHHHLTPQTLAKVRNHRIRQCLSHPHKFVIY